MEKVSEGEKMEEKKESKWGKGKWREEEGSERGRCKWKDEEEVRGKEGEDAGGT